MHQMRKRNVINRYLLYASAVLILAAVVYVAFATRNNTPEVVASPKTVSTQPANSQFSFTGAPDWRQGPTNATSMALFHGHNCFTSIEYKTGIVNMDAELEKVQASLADMDYTSTPGSILTVSLQSSEGQKPLEVHQYAVTGVGSAGKVKGGQEYGYLQLQDGYLEIEGHCDTVDQLPLTIPALQAIKFNYGTHRQ